MSEQKYQTKLAQRLWELYREWDEQLAETGGLAGIVYNLLRAEIPYKLMDIDKNEELRGKIREFVGRLAEIVKEEETPAIDVEPSPASDDISGPNVKWGNEGKGV